GIPPSTGFATKLFLIFASLNASSSEVLGGSAYVFVGVLLLSSLLNLVYFWRVIERMYFVKPEEETDGGEREAKKDEIPISMLVPMLILAILCIVVGILWLTVAPSSLINETFLRFGMEGVVP
ncbi:MAG: hypothetical protein HWN68_20805, partial [Desulfobacterales bacterium]|nr:hypothetical protein [Desulfobacterales bacterium]